MSKPEPITRPNGKVYRPRKLVAHAWEDPWDYTGAQSGVVVLGSNDVARVSEFAVEMCNYWFLGYYAVNPRTGWYRLGYQSGELRWLIDEECGRAGVFFDAADDPPASLSVLPEEKP